ncbi:MAG: M20/M25/M40 family metallo-hydrolase [Alicyclobacillus sp.]|nr:M20/M25/M40 family metallo-hydrolase [Alicyclobacillus sp.]
METLELLQKLCDIPAPTGYEIDIARFVHRYCRMFASAVEVDHAGNVLARVTPPRPDAPRAMLFAHLDEVGFVVKKVEPDGFLRIARMGGIPEKSIASQRIVVLGTKGPVPGLIGTRSHHLTPQDLKYRVVPIEEAYVDLGCRSRAEVAELGIEPGTPAVYERSFWRAGPRVFANALDNRIGLTAILKAGEALAQSAPETEVWIVATTQEEFSLRGVLPAVRALQPQMAICVDISPACDTPELIAQADSRLGGGPIVSRFTFHSRGMLLGLIPDPALWEAALAAARALSIPVQHSAMHGILTDASYVQYEGSGIATLDLAIATRYTHAAVECCDVGDLEQLIQLLEGTVRQWSSGPLKSRRDLVLRGLE